MINIAKFESCWSSGGAPEPVMKEKLEQFRTIFYDYDVIIQRWSWGWCFYIFISHSGIVRLNFPFNQPEVAIISDLVVKKSSRRTGIGRELMDICEKTAILMEARTLGIWADPKAWPIVWYQRLGFLRHHTPMTGDAYLEKPLTPRK